MPNSRESQVITLDDVDQRCHLHATWSKSGKRLILTVTTRAAHSQIELTPDQVLELGEFLIDSDKDR